MQGRRPSNGEEDGAIACFVSPHGLGHAARAAAVLAALGRRFPGGRFHLYTTVPEWFFADSLPFSFLLDSVVTDVGLVQKTPLVEDLSKTADRLDAFYPLDAGRVHRMARILNERGTRLVICDIAPLGIAVAGAAGIPSVLLENFTWDWIYQGYAARQPRFARHMDYLSALFDSADHRLRARPACGEASGDLIVNPVSRAVRTDREAVRRRLGVLPDERLILVSLGGTPLENGMLGIGPIPEGTRIVVPHGRTPVDRPRLLAAPPDAFYHPDLIGACDAVIGKTGYSTLAEVFHAGVPMGIVGRNDFRESAVLEAFAVDAMGALRLDAAELKSGAWIHRISEIIASGRFSKSAPNGAEAAADFIAALLE